MLRVQEWNERAFFFVNGDLASPLLDPLFVALSWIGGGAIALPVVWLLARADWRAFLWRHLPALLLGTLVVWGTVHEAKDSFDVDRPVRHFRRAVAAGEVTLRLPAGEVASKRAFPSGHSALAFFFMTYLSLALRRHARWALPLAALAALARVYVGAHFPLDLLGGATVGAGIAGGAWWMQARLPGGTGRPGAVS